VEREKGERYSQGFCSDAVQLMKACDNIPRLSRELGIDRRLLYHWRDRLDQGALLHPGPESSSFARKSSN
jgi:transposase-like protein